MLGNEQFGSNLKLRPYYGSSETSSYQFANPEENHQIVVLLKRESISQALIFRVRAQSNPLASKLLKLEKQF